MLSTRTYYRTVHVSDTVSAPIGENRTVHSAFSTSGVIIDNQVGFATGTTSVHRAPPGLTLDLGSRHDYGSSIVTTSYHRSIPTIYVNPRLD
jgi:hypothetical protein